ncbi:WD repeat-containing protein 3 [Nematostella vectensis]|uniref:WD repeat-containing protein 3 n=1 Tax=Nematostella vectensis TaxID=45351 RepID=UPI0020770D83|nr:WD repeat-containing protein 3 [Nematostella vectensis]
MVLTKSYLRYASLASFGVVGSLKSNVLFVSREGARGVLAVAAALEDVVIWDTRRQEKVLVLKGSKSEVTGMAISPDNKSLAAGYEDGTIKIWGLKHGNCQVTLSGHRSAVSVLKFDHTEGLLASGSRDTDVIVWDVVNESGLYRLQGHKGMITQLEFFKEKSVLVTSSKDMLVKMWDLDTQHCFLTLVGHSSEVWSFTLARNERRLVTGCGDSELRVWEVKPSVSPSDDKSAVGDKRTATDADLQSDQVHGPVSCELLGSLTRKSRSRVVSLQTDPTGQVLACLGNDSLLEIFRVASDEEVEKSLLRKIKKARKRHRKEASGVSEDVAMVIPQQTVDDELHRIHSLKLTSRIKAFDIRKMDDEVKILVLLQNNTLEVHHVPYASTATIDTTLHESVSHPGHRSDIRTLSLSSDGMCILSGSHESIKLWNRESQQCIRTMETGYALSSFFVPGDKHVIVGTKAGAIEIYNVASGSLLETVDAHEGPVWCLALAPDKRGFVSGSGDSCIKFWEFELITDENYSKSSKRLSVAHVQTLKLKEEVMCAKYSGDQRFLAVSLLDCTVKVFFADTLKFFLSLYGHKLPVMAMDISSDSTLIVTGSADKNIKIWGLDFGDCHKSIFSHDDSIMALQFISNTHYFMSVSKDKTLKYWDADQFEQIMVLQGHQSEIWCLAISRDGEFVVTGSHDRSLRLWQRTDEPVVLEEEREQEREAMYEQALAQGPEQVIPGEVESEAAKAGKKTMETVKAAEQLMEAIQLYREETAKMAEYREASKGGSKVAPPPVHPILKAYGGMSPSRYVLHVTTKIRSSELEEALMVLPFDYVTDFLRLADTWIKASLDIELVCRCMFFLMRIHHNQIVSTEKLSSVVDSLRTSTKAQIQGLHDMIGFNLAGLEFMRQEMEARRVSFFTGAEDKLRNIRKKQKTVRHVFT